jgi:BMFP domain-containing protein YqiC
LEGVAAQIVFTQLHQSVTDSYRELKAEMDSRFRTIETPRYYAAQFSQMTQKPNKTFEDYAADLKRLYDKAHRSKRAREEDLVQKFLD